ncbi:response regulator [Candidatus Venteria ishoeyi]|uniref:response regulator n=1 Tax=Candidatus Venteria ishoeyi TaxID=1899563 RepID=UPI0025A61ED0|nr:response regulator [Candidatus Venteria ishoeyi]MDM8547753.1 response regulator [Candidatus Venteria ishoeyi]
MRGIHFKLKTKLIFLTLTAAILPVLAVGLWSVSVATDSLVAGTYAQLEAAAMSRKAELERLFRNFSESAIFAASLPSVYDYFDKFEAIGLDPDLGFASTKYQTALQDYAPVLKNHTINFQDLYLITNSGDIVYSAQQGENFGKNLKKDPELASTGLARAYQRALAEQQAIFEDFSLYPSLKGVPAAFFALPLEVGKTAKGGILIVRIDTEKINQLTHEAISLSETSEAYLVGPDYKLRSGHQDAGISLKTSLISKIEANGKSRSLISRALQGESGRQITSDWDNEHPVAAVFMPMKAFDQTWALMVEIHEYEMRGPVIHFIKQVSSVGVGMFILVLLLGSAVTYNILRQLGGDPMLIQQLAHNIAKGNLHTITASSNKDSVYTAMQEMMQSLHGIIQVSGHALSSLAQGDLKARIDANAGFVGDFALTRAATNDMVKNLREIIIETNTVLRKLAQGERQIEVVGRFPGDFVEIKNALEDSIAKLAQATAENERQNWLKTGQAQLNERLRGEQDIRTLAKNSIDFLVTYLDLQIGLFYVIEKDDDSQSYLRVAADYGYLHDDNSHAHKFYIGEGLVGQAVLERKPIVRHHSQEESTRINQSGLAQVILSEVMLLPFLYEDTVKGVIELGSNNNFSSLQRDFLLQAMPSIAIALNASESRSRTQELLEQSQTQSEELQAQQVEMQHTNEELQSQTEELQAQQEELSQANETLERRGREMERQQQAVEEKNAELEEARITIQSKAEDLELASKYKSEFLANMSHELRTPLNSLLILAQLLETNKDGNLTDKQIECAHTIHGAGNDLLALINEILDLSKVEAGKVDMHPEKLKLDKIITTLEQKFRHVAENKCLYFNMQKANKLPEFIHTDPQRLHQIINNLLSNAFKFTAQGGITLDMRRPDTDEDLSRSGLNPAETIVFSVADTGIGIPREKQKVIFEAFQQADGSTSRRFGGTGLGLSISRQLVQLMGGEIQIHSKENAGSRFIIYLPEEIARTDLNQGDGDDNAIASVSPIESAYQATPEAEATPIFTPEPQENYIIDDRQQLSDEDKSLLIIEDDHAFAKTLMNLAQEKDFKCLLAEDGREGLILAEEFKPSAIMLDVGLPQVDGWTVMEKLKDNPSTRHIPVHFVSGGDDHQEARKMGAVGYAIKPVSMGDLSEVFKKIEYFINKTVKDLLLVTDSEQHAQNVLEVISNAQVNCTQANTQQDALRLLCSKEYECIVLDISVEHDTGMQLLEQLSDDEKLMQMPIIIYTERHLTEAEDNALQQYRNSLNIKAVRSPERLLDEATLFLHGINAKLPEAQRNMLRMVHDKEAILSQKKVLVIDDDVRNSFAITVALEAKGMNVIMAPNGKDGLKQLDDNPDTALVLMDIMMPEMDGYETMREIRTKNHYRKLPIIALTAKAMKGDRIKCIEAGASDYLAKPVETDKLLSLLRVWLYQ